MPDKTVASADNGHSSSFSLLSLHASSAVHLPVVVYMLSVGGLALLTHRLPFEVSYDAACCWGGEMHCSPHDAWCPLALLTRTILGFIHCLQHPNEHQVADYK